MTQKPSNVLIYAATAAALVTVICITFVAVAIDDGARASTMIGLIVTPLTSLFTLVLVLGKVNAVGDKIDEVQQDTSDLKNGVMERKIERSLLRILPDHLTTPEARESAENGDTP